MKIDRHQDRVRISLVHCQMVATSDVEPASANLPGQKLTVSGNVYLQVLVSYNNLSPYSFHSKLSQYPHHRAPICECRLKEPKTDKTCKQKPFSSYQIG